MIERRKCIIVRLGAKKRIIVRENYRKGGRIRTMPKNLAIQVFTKEMKLVKE